MYVYVFFDFFFYSEHVFTYCLYNIRNILKIFRAGGKTPSALAEALSHTGRALQMTPAFTHATDILYLLCARN